MDDHSRQINSVLVAGSSGFVGQALCSYLAQHSYDVHRLLRSPSDSPNTHQWNPEQQDLSADILNGMDAIVSIGGKNVISLPWTAKKKRAFTTSRVDSTALIAKTIAGLTSKPKVWISASAVGYYGDTGDNAVDEDSPHSDTFLSELCQQWESATQPAEDAGVRVAHMRISLILGRNGGALKGMLLPFKLGIAGCLGSGTQYMSWLTLEDMVRSIEFCMTNPDISGPVNACSPNPVTNYDFTKTLGRALHRPTLFPMPAFIARLLLGQAAEELFLFSSRIMPQKLQHHQFEFSHPTLESAFDELLK